MPGSSFKGAARPGGGGGGPGASAFGRRPRGFSTSTPTPDWTMYGGAPGEFRKPGDKRRSTGQNWTMYGGARGEYREPDWGRYRRGKKSHEGMPDRDLQVQWRPANFGQQPGAIAVAAVIDVDSPGGDVLTPDVVAAVMVAIRLMTGMIEYTIGIKPYLDVVRALRTIYHDQALTRENAAALVAALVSCRGIPGGAMDRLIALYDGLANEAGWRPSSEIFVAPALGLFMTIPPKTQENAPSS